MWPLKFAEHVHIENRSTSSSKPQRITQGTYLYLTSATHSVVLFTNKCPVLFIFQAEVSVEHRGWKCRDCTRSGVSLRLS